MRSETAPPQGGVRWNEVGAVALVCMVVLPVAWAWTNAAWGGAWGRLPLLLAAVGLLVGGGAARFPRVPAGIFTFGATLIGLLLAWLGTMTALAGDYTGTPRERVVLLVRDLATWLVATWTGGRADPLPPFVFGMAFAAFALGFCAMWWTFRARAPLFALLIPGAALIATLATDRDLPGKPYLAAFLLGAVPLAARFAGEREEDRWQRAWIRYPLALRERYLAVGCAVAAAIVLLATALPLTTQSDLLKNAWQRAQPALSDAATRAERQIFSPLGSDTNGPTVIPGFAAFGSTFRLAGSLNLSDAPAIYLTSAEPRYLRANAYDTYTGLGWEDRAKATFNPRGPNGATYAPEVSVAARQTIPQPARDGATTERVTCEMQLLAPRGGLLPICGTMGETFSTDARVTLGWQQFGEGSVALGGPMMPANVPEPLTNLVLLTGGARQLRVSGAASIPPDPNGVNATVTPDGTLVLTPGAMRGGTNWNPGRDELAGLVAQAQMGRPPGARAINRVLIAPPGMAETTTDPQLNRIADEQERLRGQLLDTQLVMRDGRVTQILYRGQTPNFADVMTYEAAAPLAPGVTVSSTARYSVATAAELGRVRAQYPAWADRYRTLPDGSAPGTVRTPQRVRDLARQLANGQNGPYAIADATERYLRTAYTYATTVPEPPANTDVTDFFLFTTKQGYCEYYATAMTVLMRANGIPARVVNGYLPGIRQADGRWLSRESQAHAWVEVYFPSHGWITFDPTPRPDVPPIQRGPTTAPAPVPTPMPAPAPDAAVPGVAPTPTPNPADDPAQLTRPDGAENGPRINPWWLFGPLLALLLGGVVAAAVAWWWLAPLRGLRLGARWYFRLQRSAGLLGVRQPQAATPYELAEALGERLPAARGAATVIAHRYAEEQYAGRLETAWDEHWLRRAWEALRADALRTALYDRLHRRGRKK